MAITIHLGNSASIEEGLKVMKALQGAGLRGRDVDVDLSKIKEV